MECGRTPTYRLTMANRARTQANNERAQHLIERARELFIELASNHGLTLTWDEKAPVELAAHLLKQPGLDWSLWLNLQGGDEIGVQSDWFSVEWFPADNREREAKFMAALNGLLSGSVRLVCKFGARRRFPYSVLLESESDSGWVNVARYYKGIHFGRAKGIMILRNGHDPILGGRARSLPLLV